MRRDPGPDLWIYRLSCAQCLSVALVEVPEVSALSRSEPSRPVVDIAGAVVARILERLRAAAGRAELAEVHRATREEPEHRVLLRIPEVAALVRPAFADGAWLAEDLVMDWPAMRDSSRPSGRLTLHRPSRRFGDDDPVIVSGEALELRMRAGRHCKVLGFEGGTLLLAPPREDAAIVEWLADVELLIAWADFVTAAPPA